MNSMVDIYDLDKTENEQFQQASIIGRKEYLNLIAELSSSLKSIDFDLSRLGSRDPYLSPLFNQICEIIFFKNKIDDGHFNLKTSNFLISEILRKYALDKNVRISSEHHRSKSYFFEMIEPIYKCINSIFHLSFQYLFATFFSKNSKNLQSDIILVDTFLTQNLVKDGKYQDRYYYYFNDIELFKNGKILYLPTFAAIDNYCALIKEAKKLQSNNFFLFKENYLKIQDYFFAFMHTFRIQKIVPKGICISGINVDPLIQYELKRNHFGLSTITALLNYRFSNRLKDEGIYPKILINWSENQVVDKGLVKGFSTNFPNVSLRAYQSVMMDPFYNFHLHPTSYEVRNSYFPKKVFVTGEAQKIELLEFTNDLDVNIIQSFRNQNNTYNSKSSHTKLFLVALPIFKDLSEKILIFLSRIINKFNDSSFLIKFHPAMTLELSDYGLNKENVAIAQSISTQEVIQKCDIVISSTSAICIEAVQIGRPVLILTNRGTIFQSPLPKKLEDQAYFVFDDEKELEKLLLNYSNLINPDLFKIYSEQITNSYFSRNSTEDLLSD